MQARGGTAKECYTGTAERQTGALTGVRVVTDEAGAQRMLTATPDSVARSH
jgi:hypothetical protein